MRWERDFTQLSNRWLRDERISYRARGILGALFSHTTEYRVTLKKLSAASKGEGIDAVRTAVNELESAGYLVRIPRNRRGQFTGDEWTLVDPFELTALDDPTRTATALDDPTRTALDDPTPIEDQLEDVKSSRGDHRGACGHALLPGSNEGTNYCVMGCSGERVRGAA